MELLTKNGYAPAQIAALEGNPEAASAAAVFAMDMKKAGRSRRRSIVGTKDPALAMFNFK